MRRVLKCAGTDNLTIKVSDVPSPFDLQDLIEIDHGYYCLANNNAIEATNDIIMINSFLYEAAELCPEFPNAQISIPDINFKYNPDSNFRDYVILKVAPLTPSGKLPKYPLCLCIANTKLYYGQDRKVQKARIIVWENTNCFELNLAMHGKELSVHSIYKTSLIDSVKRKIYE